MKVLFFMVLFNVMNVQVLIFCVHGKYEIPYVVHMVYREFLGKISLNVLVQILRYI